MTRSCDATIALLAACGLTLTPAALAQEVVSSKRGFADVGAGYSNLQATGAGWYYTWGLGDGNPGNFDASHAPMFWAGWAVNQTNINNVKNNPNVEWVLGFNEPERSDQANMSVSSAISAWRTLSDGFSGTDKKLVTPAVSDTADGKAWMQAFRDQAVAEGLKVDAVAFHWYGWSSPNNIEQAAANFMGSVNWYYNLWNKPVFITEFAIHDWGGSYTVEEIEDANRRFLDIIIPQLESSDRVAGYAWYHWFSDANLYKGSPPTPTPMAYEYTGVVETGEAYDIAGTNHRERVAFLAGGTLRNSGAAGTALSYINALEGRSSVSSDFDWSLEPGGWVRVQPGAILRKADEQRWDIGGGTSSNQGTLEIIDGTLATTGNISGSGTLIIGTFGNATLAQLELDGDVSVANPIGFRGRTNSSPSIVNAGGDNYVSGPLLLEFGGSEYILRADAGSLNINGRNGAAFTTLENMNDRLVTLDGDADGSVRDAITDEPGTALAIRKAGTGTWTLRGDNTYTGTTEVAGGTLEIETATGAGPTTVLPGATLAADGTVRDSLTAADGATVRVGEAGLPTLVPTDHDTVDGFGFYPTGSIGSVPNSTGDLWTGVFNGTGNAQIVSNAGDNALRVIGLGGTDWRGAIADLGGFPSGDFSLPDGETGTYFFRVRRVGEGSMYAVLGLSDQAASTGAAPGNDTESPWDEYAVTVSIVGNHLNTAIRANNAGGADTVVTTTTNEQWVNVWLTVDNDAKTFRVATSTGADDGTDSGTEFGFGRRTGTDVATNAIVTLGLHESRGIPVEIDDIHFAPGTDLTNPLGEGLPTGQTLAIMGDLNLSGGSQLLIDLASPDTHDAVSVAGTLNLGGHLEVSSGSPLADPQAGDRYELLGFSASTGSFDTVTLPELPEGLAWDTSTLSTDGALTITQGGCNAADLSPEYGTLDLSDISVFVNAFTAQQPAADLDSDGTHDLTDISLFVNAFSAGCP